VSAVCGGLDEGPAPKAGPPPPARLPARQRPPALQTVPPPSFAPSSPLPPKQRSYQIRTDTSPVYGDGFRRALELYQLRGLRALFDHVLTQKAWPTGWDA
jgi:hypothetical protein